MHGRESIDSYESGLAHCTLPEVTGIWYIDLEPVCAMQEFIQMARLIVQARNNEDTPTTCVRLCISIGNVEMLQYHDNDDPNIVEIVAIVANFWPFVFLFPKIFHLPGLRTT